MNGPWGALVFLIAIAIPIVAILWLLSRPVEPVVFREPDEDPPSSAGSGTVGVGGSSWTSDAGGMGGQ